MVKKGPIFIVGMNGSGTTMLADCLNQHPMIYIPKYESKIIPFYWKNRAAYGNLNNYKNFQALLDDFSSAYFVMKLNNNRPINVTYNFDRLQEKSISTAIDMVFSHFGQSEGKIFWGDHSPKYATCLPILIKLFPNAKIIHIIRDGRDCVLSFKRRFHQNIYRGIYQWKKNVQKAI